jgi:hypothetical protein
MYEDIVAETRRATEAAVRESQERVSLATRSAAEADKNAAEASKSYGDRWANRINAMRRRAADRGKSSSAEMEFGHEDGPHPNDHGEADDLISLTDETAPSAADAETPPFGIPEEELPPYRRPQASPPPGNDWFTPVVDDDPPAPAPPPRRPPQPQRRLRPMDDDDEDYSAQSWLQDH